MAFRIQKVGIDQMETALNLFKRVSLHLQRSGVDQWAYWQDPPQEKLDWIKEGFGLGEFNFVFNEAEELVGMFRLLEKDVLYWGDSGLDENTRYVHSLVVDPQYKGQGIGAFVLEHLKKVLPEQGIIKMRLDCVASNKRLCAYYLSQGFDQVGEKKTPYGENALFELRLENQELNLKSTQE